MSQRLVAVVGRNNTQAEVTGQNELLVKVSSLQLSPGSAMATEATLQQVLAAVDNMRDYEVRLVEDSTTPNKVTWLEVRYWDAQSGTLGVPQYYLPGSTTAGSPVLPISYINDRTLLTQILTALQGTLTVAGTVALDTPTLTALENITVQNGAGAAAVNIQDGGNSITVDGSVSVSNFPASLEISNDVGNPVPVSGTVTITDGSGPVTVDGTVAATQSGTWNVNNITGTVSLPTGAATESTLSTLNSQFTAVTRTPALIRATGSGTIAAGARSISVFNAGSAAGSILGGVGNILPGEVLEFSAGGENDTLAAFAYNGAGTTLVITSIV